MKLDVFYGQASANDGRDESARCECAAAVVVTYNPDPEGLRRGLRAIAQQVGYIVVVDNASRNLQDCQLEQFEQTFGVELAIVALQSNVGLGAGFNAGIKRARAQGYSFVLLLDQDSVPQNGMVKKLDQAYKVLSKTDPHVAAVGPRFRDPGSGSLSNFSGVVSSGNRRSLCDGSNGSVMTDFLISSGSYISMAALDDVGEMDESLFIDYVDAEWCLRAKSKGWSVHGVCNAIIEHSLGEMRRRFWFLRWRTISHHASFRYYYIFRNSLLLRNRAYVASSWKRANLLHLVMLAVYLGMIAPNRIANLKTICRGISDGKKNVSGPMSSA